MTSINKFKKIGKAFGYNLLIKDLFNDTYCFLEGEETHPLSKFYVHVCAESSLIYRCYDFWKKRGENIYL